MPNEIPNQNDESEEIDITELIGRIETLEKENTENKEKIKNLENSVRDTDESFDALIEKLKE